MAKEKSSVAANTLHAFAGLFEETDRAYKAGREALEAAVKAKWQSAFEHEGGSHKATLVSTLMLAVIRREYIPVLVEVLMGEGKYLALSQDWSQVTELTGYMPTGFNRHESAEALRILGEREKPTLTSGGGLLALASAAAKASSQARVGFHLRQFTDRLGPWAERKGGATSHDRGDRRGKVAAEVMAQTGKSGTRTPPVEPKLDRKAELMALLEKAKADKAKALADEDGDGLKTAKAAIAALEAELTQLEEAEAKAKATSEVKETPKPETVDGKKRGRAKATQKPAKAEEKPKVEAAPAVPTVPASETDVLMEEIANAAIIPTARQALLAQLMGGEDPGRVRNRLAVMVKAAQA